jgi:hypothetical protein
MMIVQQESRMRENCTSGSMRGSDGIGTASRGHAARHSLLYWLCEKILMF